MDIKKIKTIFNIGLLVFFVWLLIISYSSSKRKPDNVGELLNDFSWLQKWPKWLDLPLMKWINVGFKKLNETYGFIFEAINNFLLAMLMALKIFYISSMASCSVRGYGYSLFCKWKKNKNNCICWFLHFLHWLLTSNILAKSNRNHSHHVNKYFSLFGIWNACGNFNV